MRAAAVGLVLLLAATTRAGEEAGVVRLKRTAPIEDLKAAIAERVVFDGIDIELPAKTDEIVLRRAKRPGERYDRIEWQLRWLDESISRRRRYASMTDEELLKAWNEVDSVPPRRVIDMERDAALLEIVHRGGDVWRSRLQARFDALVKLRDSRPSAGDAGTADELADLIALRRVEDAPAPVRATVVGVESCTFPDLPTAEFRMTVADELAVTMSKGGGYRSGRLERYYVEVRDGGGRLMPSRRWIAAMGGGLFTRAVLHKGESLGATLPLAHYVAPLASGKYRVRLHYSDVHAIAEADGAFDFLTVTSDWLDVVVAPRVVETTSDDQTRLAALVEALPTTGPAQILDGPYGAWAHAFVPPDSAAGKLLLAGWKSVRVLAEFVERKDVDLTRRAWALAVLYDIVGLEDPAGAAAGTHQAHSGGERSFLGAGTYRTSTSLPPPQISADAQDDLAAKWAEIAKGIELRGVK